MGEPNPHHDGHLQVLGAVKDGAGIPGIPGADGISAGGRGCLKKMATPDALDIIRIIAAKNLKGRASLPDFNARRAVIMIHGFLGFARQCRWAQKSDRTWGLTLINGRTIWGK